MLAPLLAVGLLATPVHAQSDERVRRLEAEIRALQRAVFPGGSDRFFEPEISTAQPQQPTQPVGTPAESALTDVLARLSAIESQLARLTANTEVNSNALEQLETRMDEGEAALAGLSGPTGRIPVPGSSSPSSSGSSNAAPLINGGELPALSPSSDEQPNADGGPSPQRVSAVEAIAKPATADAGDDEYVYGFRLWEAGFYPEAQQQLSMFIEQYPSHWRTTYARNLLGRAFFDAGNARQAANFFFENYQSDKQGARAPDSLLYLAQSMVSLGDTNRACIALAEFGDTYPALATGRLQEQYETNRSRVDCN